MITNRLKEIRNGKGVTQQELAYAIGVIRQTVIAIEQNRYRPSVELALRIADYFKVPVETIFRLNP